MGVLNWLMSCFAVVNQFGSLVVGVVTRFCRASARVFCKWQIFMSALSWNVLSGGQATALNFSNQ